MGLRRLGTRLAAGEPVLPTAETLGRCCCIRITKAQRLERPTSPPRRQTSPGSLSRVLVFAGRRYKMMTMPVVVLPTVPVLHPRAVTPPHDDENDQTTSIVPHGCGSIGFPPPQGYLEGPMGPLRRVQLDRPHRVRYPHRPPRLHQPQLDRDAAAPAPQGPRHQEAIQGEHPLQLWRPRRARTSLHGGNRGRHLSVRPGPALGRRSLADAVPECSVATMT